MDPAELQTLASDAATYDSVIVLWVTPRGTQPVLMPLSLGRPRLPAPISSPTNAEPASGGSHQVTSED